MIGCSNTETSQTTTKEYSYDIERSYVTPTRIVWQSGDIENAEQLLVEGKHQSTTQKKDVIVFNFTDSTSAILLNSDDLLRK